MSKHLALFGRRARDTWRALGPWMLIVGGVLVAQQIGVRASEPSWSMLIPIVMATLGAGIAVDRADMRATTRMAGSLYRALAEDRQTSIEVSHTFNLADADIERVAARMLDLADARGAASHG